MVLKSSFKLSSTLARLSVIIAILILIACSEKDDPPGIHVIAADNLIINKDGSPAVFSIVLTKAPSSDVSITARTSDADEGRISLVEQGPFTESITLLFKPNNWHVHQKIFIKAHSLAPNKNGNHNYKIILEPAVSQDPQYQGMDVADITVTNVIDPAAIDVGSLLISPTTELVTFERGGSPATFEISLSRPPTAKVTVRTLSSNPQEGIAEPKFAAFSSTNWNRPLIITVKGVDDDKIDGDQNYTIDFAVFSEGTDFDDIMVPSINAVNRDNESGSTGSTGTTGVSVTPTAGLITDENGLSAIFSVVLTSAPTQNVVITPQNINTAEGAVTPSNVIFTSNNWSIPRDFTITGQDDGVVVDGPQSYIVSLSIVSGDLAYDQLSQTAVPTISVTNLDNDSTPVTGIIVTPTGGLLTSENAGSSTTFTVWLNTSPAASETVVISASSNNPAEGTVSASINLTSSNWQTGGIFTVTGVDDTIVDGNQPYTITLGATSSLGSASPYHLIAIAPVDVINQDNETASISLALPPSGIVTSENKTSSTFTVVLDAEPAASVTITASSSNIAEGTLSPGSVTFTQTGATIWNQPQTFTVTGVDDTIVDGNIDYNITFMITSPDPTSPYRDLSISPVPATNTDNDSTTQSLSLTLSTATYDITASPDSNGGALSVPALGYGNPSTPKSQSPGPVFTLFTNQPMSLNLTNDTGFDHNFEIPGASPAVSMLAPQIGNVSNSVMVNFIESGIYRYGSADLGGRGSGYFGAIVVKPADGTMTAWTNGPTYQKERNWVISDFDPTWVKRVPTDPATINTTVYDPTYFLINGKNGHAAMQDINTKIDGQVGEKILVRILNAGQYDQSLHFHGNHFVVLSQDGVNNMILTDATIAGAPKISTINVKRNSTAMILYTLKQPGKYPVHVHTANMMTSNGVYLNGTATLITVCNVTPCP